MSAKKPKIQAIMNLEKGEAIAGMWVSPFIPQVGFYKLLAKRTANGACIWVHFLQREDGAKKVLLRGDLESEDGLKTVVDACNKTLSNTFGIGIRLKPAEFDTYTIDGHKFGDNVH
jgi:hypothetical protein